MNYYYYREPERPLELPEPEVDGILVCEECEEVIPGGDPYFEIEGHAYCECCARYRFGHTAPYREDYAPEP